MKNPTLKQCIEGMEKLCSDLNLSKEEIIHRARLAYFMNILGNMDDLHELL